MKLDRWRKLATLSLWTMLSASLPIASGPLWGIDSASAQYDDDFANNTHYTAHITDGTAGNRQLTMTGNRLSTQFWSGAIQYSATSRQTPYRNWTRRLPFWSRQSGGPGLEHHRDFMEMFDLPTFLPRFNGPVTIDREEGQEIVADARTKELTVEYDGGWPTPPGNITSQELEQLSTTAPRFYLPTGEDASQLLFSRLVGLGIQESYVESFMRGEITPEQLVDLANGNYLLDGGDSSDGITLEDVLNALGNIKVSIGFQAGFKFSTEAEGKLALKFIIGIEMNVKDLATVLAYGMQPAVRKMEQTITETTDLTQDLARLQQSLNDDGRDPEDGKPPRPWYQDYIDVWGGFFGTSER